LSSPITVICVNHNGSVPPVAADITTGATESTTGAGSFNLFKTNATTQVTYWNGIQFNSGNAANLSAFFLYNSLSCKGYARFDNCIFNVNNTNTGSGIGLGPSGESNDVMVDWYNTKVQFGAAAQCIFNVDFRFRWLNTTGAIVLGTVPTTLFSAVLVPSILECRGVDFSNLGTNALITLGVTGSTPDWSLFENCKFGLSPLSSSLISGSFATQGCRPFRFINCGAGGTNYLYRLSGFQGDIYSETSVTRNGGATDGTTPVSRKVVSSANVNWFSPLESDPIIFWNISTSAITINVYVICDNYTIQNTDVAMKIEYLGNASFPISTLDLSTQSATILTTGSAQPTDSVSTWNGTGGFTSPVLQKLSATITPAMAGPIKVTIMCMKPSFTFYYDPLRG